jgi:predicted DNA-binding ribbon-helix-helix protein
MPRRPKGWFSKGASISSGVKPARAWTAFWVAFNEIAAAQGTTIGHLIATIDHERHERRHINLSSANRLFVLDYYRHQVERGAVP